MTVIEKILAAHAGVKGVAPGDILDIEIDARVARDFGGANVVKHLKDHELSIHDEGKTFFTFDCNPTGSDQKYAGNQHLCRQFARERNIRVFDIDKGIGTHLLMEEGLAWPGSTAISTDSHANILGAIGAFGQGMGDKDIAAAWHRGKTWFKVPPTVKINLGGQLPPDVSAKDLVLNLLDHFGASSLLGCAVEIEGALIDEMNLDQRITLASMATEMGAIIILLPPNKEVIRYCESRSRRKIEAPVADSDASYKASHELDAASFSARVSLPGKPHDTVPLPTEKRWVDSAFIGSCTNGRISDLREAARILKGKKVAPGLVLKIVPATDKVWQSCLDEGLLEIFKDAGALVSNAGCAGCAAGQVGQNGAGEVTISTGNRNFPGKQGKGEVYLASPAVVAASAIAGYITDPTHLPEQVAPREFERKEVKKETKTSVTSSAQKPEELQGRIWYIPMNNIDTDMIFHNRYLSITKLAEMGQYTFDNLEGFADFASKVREGDIVVAGKNFGSGSSRQQAVDCFISLGVSCLVAESFGAIYERNAINAAFPIIQASSIQELKLEDGDEIRVNFKTGELTNLRLQVSIQAEPFSEVQLAIYHNNGIF